MPKTTEEMINDLENGGHDKQVKELTGLTLRQSLEFAESLEQKHLEEVSSNQPLIFKRTPLIFK